MIIVLNGYPGVGKLTIGRELATLMDGRLLDIHSVYNIAFALTEFKTPEFRNAVERIEAVAHDLVLKLPKDVPVVLTTVLAGQSDWGDGEWARLEALGRARPPFCVVHLSCDVDENIRRIKSEERSRMRKPRDPEYVLRNHAENKPLMGKNADRYIRLDATALSAKQAAVDIQEFLEN